MDAAFQDVFYQLSNNERFTVNSKPAHYGAVYIMYRLLCHIVISELDLKVKNKKTEEAKICRRNEVGLAQAAVLFFSRSYLQQGLRVPVMETCALGTNVRGAWGTQKNRTGVANYELRRELCWVWSDWRVWK